MSNDCKGFWGTLFGHCFIARYSETSTPPAKLGPLECPAYSMPDIIEGMTKHESVYECDVCIRCGEVTKKPQ